MTTSLRQAVKALLEADPLLDALLTGGIYDRRGINRTLTPDAYNSTTGALKPCAVITESTTTALDPVKEADFEQVFLNVWLYEEEGNNYATIDQAKDRIRYLLHRKTDLTIDPGCIHEIRHADSVGDQYDDIMKAEMVRERFWAWRKRGGPWYDPLGDGTCVAAYNALGAANIATSQINIANPGTYDLTAVNATPNWDTDDGWSKNGASSAWSTGITTSTSSWSFVVRFADAPFGNGYPFGVSSGPGHPDQVGAIPNWNVAGWRTNWYNSSWLNDATATPTGVLGIAGERCFRNGAYVGNVTTWNAATYGYSIYLLDLNDGGQALPHNPFYGKVQAFCVHNTQISDDRMYHIYTRIAAL